MLKRIISGGQTGSDEAGLVVAKRFGLETGGMMPKGFKTLNGSRPEFAQIYGIEESKSEKYPPRTYSNAKHGDGTVRFAGDFESSGEKCTMVAIKYFNKPHFDVDLTDPPPVRDFINWLTENDIEVLNVSGNSERTFNGAFRLTVKFLTRAMFELGFSYVLKKEEILDLCGLEEGFQVTCDGVCVSELRITRKKEQK